MTRRRLTFQVPVPSDPYRVPLIVTLVVILIGYSVMGVLLVQYVAEQAAL